VEETCTKVLARELIAGIRDVRLNSEEGEPADWEKWLAEQEKQLVGGQLQELATTGSRLEDL
jgi:hypothetical protein